jgi:maltooligosyltrehalose trehalohydrolase
MRSTPERRFPVGAEVHPAGGTHVRVWAPAAAQRVYVVHGDPPRQAVALEPEGDGYFSGTVAALGEGGRYAFRLDDDPKLYPDPASRFQPDGPHEPSQVVDPGRFAWTDAGWRGVGPGGQVLYELHKGTYAAAARELPALRELGVTVIELMPLADFAGRYGWGYDGVNLWAPTRLYGTPDDLRQMVDTAHRLGLGVILDVVYNHLGPDGNYLGRFAPAYFTDKYKNEWGQAINFDGQGAGPVRDYFTANAAYWVEELHLDGLRFDATQSVFDDGSHGEHVLAAAVRRARAAAPDRTLYFVAENEPQETLLVRAPDRGGFGMNALWNDDFHHSVMVALTGKNPAYYSDHLGRPQELISALRWGYLYQGQWYRWQGKRRGTPAFDLDATNFVLYLENHDQVANSGRGARLAALTAPARLRALTALMLLAPGTPMLFQGQEWGSTRPFLYFADHNPELRPKVSEGRRALLAQFPSLSGPDAQACLDDPMAPETFARCKLDRGERDAHQGTLVLHRDLIALRRSEAAFRQQRADRMHGALLGPEAFALRFLGDSAGDDRLLLVNIGVDWPLSPAPEPLLAPPAGTGWRLLWSSEAMRYGGGGAAPLRDDAGWILPGDAALVLAPEPGDESQGGP